MSVDPLLGPIDRRPHWVYRFFDRDGRLLYVGCTSNQHSRLIAWRNSGVTWWPEVVRVEWETHPARHPARLAERRAIETEGPLYNKRHNPDPVEHPAKRRLLTVAEVAAAYRVSEKAIRHQVQRRRIPFVRVGSRIRFDADRLERFWLEDVEASA